MMAFAYNAFFLRSMWLFQRRHFGGEGGLRPPYKASSLRIFQRLRILIVSKNRLPPFCRSNGGIFIKLPKSGFMVEVQQMHLMLLAFSAFHATLVFL
jgi:hypothetical protein